MRARACEFDVTQALTPNLRKRDLDAALVADDAAVFHSLVFAAQAFPVRNGTEDAGTEQAVLLRFESAVIDGFRFCYFAMRPRTNLFWRGQTDPDAVKIGDR